jgi:predicted MFS family arabinose efflux permease
MNKLSRPLWALTGCFISLGVVGNTLFARYPALQAQFQLSAADWGWTLFALGLGGLTAYPLNRLLLLRWGSQAMIQRCGVLLGFWMVGVPWAFNTLQLWLAVYVLGVLVNAISVGVNNQAAQMELSSGQRNMGKLHAMFYFGTTFSALLSSGLVASDCGIRMHFGLMGAILAGAYWQLADRLLPDKARLDDRSGVALPNSRMAGLGVMAACAALVEGGVNGWITLYLHDVLGASESVAALGIAVFSVAMMIGRFLTDSHADRWGALRLVRLGTFVAAMALGLAVISHSLLLMFFALVVVGLGQAAIFPLVFSTAGRLGGNAISGVASMGSGGGLVGPLLLGRVAAASSLPGVLLAVAGGLLALSWRAKSLHDREAPK